MDFSLPESECSSERKFHVSESSLCGLFAPGNESAEEREVQIPPFLAVLNVTAQPSTASVPTSYGTISTCASYRVNRFPVNLLTNTHARTHDQISDLTGYLPTCPAQSVAYTRQQSQCAVIRLPQGADPSAQRQFATATTPR